MFFPCGQKKPFKAKKKYGRIELYLETGTCEKEKKKAEKRKPAEL